MLGVLAGQTVFWIAMWFLLAWFDTRRQRRAKDRSEPNPPHFNELAVVLGITSTLVVLCLYAVSWVRPIGPQ